MKQIIIFGTGQVADLAQFYFTHDSDYEIAAFTVDRDHLAKTEFRGRPVVPLDAAPTEYPPDRFAAFVALGYTRINAIREQKFLEVRALGYELVSYVSSRATTWPEAAIGANCFIMENNVIQPFSRIGDDVIMWSGCHVGHGTVVGDHSFLSSHVVVSGNVTIEPNCFFGVNATIRDKIKIGRASVIGAGALITKSVPPKTVYTGAAATRLPLESDRLPDV